MIEKINLECFKAFGAAKEFLICDGTEPRNLLVYGENGSGKSSLFEALRLFFYEDRLLDSLKKEGQPLEVFEANKTNFLRSYNNQILKQDYTLMINGKTRSVFPFSIHVCYMLGNEDVHLPNEVRITDWLQDLFLPAFDVNAFWTANGVNLIKNVNKVIKDEFKEKFTIEQADRYTTLKIVDINRDLKPEKDYRRNMNEAKLHLIALLLFFETVKLHKATLAKSKDKVIVLDDIVTSLDATNRIFLVNYLIREFPDCQIILLTHNVSFFNLVNLRVGNKVDQNADKWLILNICEMGDDSELINFYEIKNSGEIANEFKRTHDASVAGNQIRQRFEAVMYEYAKLVQMDQFEDANILLARLIDKHKPVFLKQKNKNEMFWSNDLLDEITNILGTTKSAVDKVTEINTHIEDYKHKYADVKKMVDLLKEMKMFQKVVMHQLSHGTGARPTFTSTEITHSLDLLKRFEYMVTKFKDEVYGM